MSAFENPIIGNLRRINREQIELLSRIFTYVDEEGLGSIGRSRVDALIESHRALRAERDHANTAAARYLEELHDTQRGMLAEAYLLGFNASNEGYNGEYPFDLGGDCPTDDEDWVAKRDEALRELKGV